MSDGQTKHVEELESLGRYDFTPVHELRIRAIRRLRAVATRISYDTSISPSRLNGLCSQLADLMPVDEWEPGDEQPR